MKCEICGIGMKEGATLHRVNEKGVAGIWRCSEHYGGPVDEIVQILEDDMRSRNPAPTPKEL